MIGDEHCAKCDTKLGKHRFVSADGRRILCGQCFGAARSTGSLSTGKTLLRRGSRG